MSNKNFNMHVFENSNQQVNKCLQCLKCSSGCPIAPWMDYLPNQVNRMIQMGHKEKVLSSSVIWLCVGCQTCITRCPMQIDISRIMDILREMALKEGVQSKEHNVTIFHQLFLNRIKKWGRIYEIELIGLYKLKSRSFFQDMGLGSQMFRKGKLALIPEIVKGKKDIKQIFKGVIK